MSKSNAAKGFLSDLLGEDELKSVVEEAKVKPAEPTESFIVYFIGEQPDTVWRYVHKPADGKIFDINGNETGEYKGYGQLYGYYEEDKENKVSRHFVRNTSNNLKLMSFESLMNNVIPNKECTKIYESESDFLLDLI